MGVKKGTNDNQVTALTSGDTAVTVIVGVALNDADAGQSVTVASFGPCMARANGSITRDDLLECIYNATAEKNGNMKTITACANQSMIAGRALEAAADAAEFMMMLELRKPLATS